MAKGVRAKVQGSPGGGAEATMDRWTDGQVRALALLLLSTPASAHGLHHSSVELAPGVPCGWCEVRTEAPLQHVEQGLTHCREGAEPYSHSPVLPAQAGQVLLQ